MARTTDGPASLTPAFHAAHPGYDGKVGVLNWPIVSSAMFPDEGAIACPKCGSRNVLLTVRTGASGTGPSGRSRLGDSGRANLNVCQACGHTSDGHPYRER